MPKMRIEVDRPCVRPRVTFEEREGGRFCLSCQEMQHDLTNATQREALALIEANGGRICGTFRAGPSGELHFKPEAPSRAANAARGAALALALAGCGSGESAPPIGAAPPPTLAPPSTPPASLATPPPTTTATTTTDPDSALHATDASPDPADHATHVHTHAPVLVGGIGGTTQRVSGGASAFPMHDGSTEDGPRGHVQIVSGEIEETGAGDFDRNALVHMLATRRPAAQSCYERELRSNPTLAGRISIELTIDESGATSNVHVVDSTVGDDAVGLCLTRVLMASRFSPGPDGGPVTYTVPFTFAPAE